MDTLDLLERIASRRSPGTRFRRFVGSEDELAKDLTAFANTDGGQLIVGVADDRSVVGVGDADALHRAVDNVAYNNCEPPITVVQETVSVEGKTVVVVNVPKGAQRPYRTKRGRYHIRTTSGCRDASREELLRLFQATESLFYDETPLPRLGLDDLNLEALDRFLDQTGQRRLAGDPARLLRNWGLLAGGHPTIAGLLLFGREPQAHLPFAQINAARFPGLDVVAPPSDRKDITGRLLDMLADAERFLHLQLRRPHVIRGFEPEPRPELPDEALREALVNAVAHRDYTVAGPVRLFVFDDRVEIRTPGKPPNSIDAEAMRAGVHVVRNPRVYSRISDAGMVTRAGSGIPRIVALVRDATGEDIGIDVREYEVLLSIPRRAGAAPAPA